MMQALRENWPVVAFILTAAAGMLTYWSKLLWQTAANVALATKTLADHALLHGEHKAKLDQQRDVDHELELRLVVLEDARAHTADTGKHPVIHVRRSEPTP